MEKKLHYAPNGEWGQTRTTCMRYYTTDVCLTGNISKVTCKHCLKLLTSKNRTT